MIFSGTEAQVGNLAIYLNMEAESGYLLDRMFDITVTTTTYLIVITKHA